MTAEDRQAPDSTSGLGWGRFEGQGAFAGVVLALALAFGALAWAGHWAFGQLSRQMQDYSRAQALQRNAGQADSLQALYAAVLKDLETVQAALPADNPASQALNILVEGARSRNLGIASISGLDEIPFRGYRELPFDLTLSGRFPDLLAYVHFLETQGMALRLRRLGMESEGMNKSRVKARVELSVFVPMAKAGS